MASSNGLPAGLKFYSPFPFGGMNLDDGALAIQDNEFLWIENFLRLGNGNFRTAWDIGNALYSVPPGRTIVYFFFYTIATTYYVAIFLDDGSAVQVNSNTGAQVAIGPAGTFYNSANGQLPACAQWGTLYLLIANRNTVNDYWAWDGALLYASGTATPNGATILANGSNYTSAPTVTPFGGHGSGLVVVPTVNAGGVVELTITNPGTGYEVGDVVQLAFSGGGSDTSAILQANLVSGNVAAVNVTAPGSGYTSATVAFTGGGGGSGATATAQIGSGVSSVAVTAPGSGYTGATASFSGGGGTGAKATVTVTGGQVTAINVTASGSGYTSAPTVAIAGDGTGAMATATIQNGIITGITVTNGGTGYTSAPSVVISGTGSGATAVSVLQPGGVQSVTVVNGGSGFLFAPGISFVGGGGAGATGVVSLTGTSVARVNVVDGGSGYLTPPTVTFYANDGAVVPTGVAVLDQGQVVAVNLTNAGSGITNNVFIDFDPGFQGNAKDGTLRVAPGTGAAAQAILVPTSIASVTISSSGSQYTDAPAVEVASGANNSAYAVVSLMPFGLSGSALETYQQRVWLVDPAPPQFGTQPPGGNFAVTAPGSFTDIATSDGGLLFTNSDGFLQTRYVGVRQSNGYLYMFGDGSISIISSVNTSGNPPTTVFNYQNVDPQTGMSFRDSRQDFSKTILFSNETGIYGLYGGTATMVSAKIRDLFNQAIFPPTGGALTPSSAVATLFDEKHYLHLMTVFDPELNVYRNMMATWNEKGWSLTTQSVDLTLIGSQKVNSKLFAWGTNGTSLYPLFARPSATLTKRLSSKLYGGGPTALMIKSMRNFWMQAQDQSSPNQGVNCNISIAYSGIAVQPTDTDLATVVGGVLTNILLVNANFQAPKPTWPIFATRPTSDVPFTNLGFRLSTTSPDFVIGGVTLGYTDVEALIG